MIPQTLIDKDRQEQKTLDNQMKKPSSVQPATKEATVSKNWDAHFGNMDENRQQAVRFGGDGTLDKVFMNALNGQYRGYIDHNAPKLTKSIGGLNDGFKTLGNKAWEIATLAKNGKTNADLAKLNVLREEFQQQFDKTNKDVRAVGKDYGLDFDANFKLINPEKKSENSQEAVVRKGFGTNQQVKEGSAGLLEGATMWLTGGTSVLPDAIEKVEDKTFSYRKIQGAKKDMTDLLQESYSPVIKSWSDFGFANWSNDRFGSETGKYDNREKTVALGSTALLHISKYGSPNDADQKKAIELLRQINSSKDVTTRQQVFKSNENEIKELINGMGYYGQKTVIEKYKDQFSSQYYKGGEKEMTTLLNQVTTLTDQKTKTDQTFLELDKKAGKEILLTLNQKKTPFITERGSSAGISSAGISVTSNNNYNPNADTTDDNIDAFVGDYMFNNKKGKLISFDEVRKEMKPLGASTQRGYWAVNVPKGVGNKQDQFGNQHLSYNALKDAYDRVATQYHEKFNDLKSDEIFRNSLLVVGQGKERSQHIGHDNIDFKVDSAKNRNAHIIKNVIKDGLENGNVLVSAGGYNASAIESNLEQIKNEDRKKAFETFLNNDKQYDVTFSRNSPIKDKSAYIFSTKGKNPKTMTFYVDTKKASEYGEMYAKSTELSPQEYSYRQSGKWDLSAWNDSYKYVQNPKIVTRGGLKYLGANVYNAEQDRMVYEEEILGPDGNTQIQDAEEKAKVILDKYEDYIKQHLQK